MPIRLTPPIEEIFNFTHRSFLSRYIKPCVHPLARLYFNRRAEAIKKNQIELHNKIYSSIMYHSSVDVAGKIQVCCITLLSLLLKTLIVFDFFL
jgi:hypothetical protein